MGTLLKADQLWGLARAVSKLTAGVVCCSSDRKADLCISETAQECSSKDGSHSCCDERKYTYNPVPCATDWIARHA
ncbi:hypothetical protein DIPPA_20468 [Diplonema papillatum]|nr:hypothetical protein DIPPA_20468 [Diplonema papillatum]